MILLLKQNEQSLEAKTSPAARDTNTHINTQNTSPFITFTAAEHSEALVHKDSCPGISGTARHTKRN